MDLEKLMNSTNKIHEIAREASDNPDDMIKILLSSLLLFLGNTSINEEVYEHNLEQAITEMKEFPMRMLLITRNLCSEPQQRVLQLG